jgi:hypothetical protein
MATYTITYTGRNHPTNVDGVAAGLRVTRNAEYLQFFLPIVSGPDLASLESSSYPSEEWWRALVRLGLIEVELHVTQVGFKPNDDPTQGRHLPITAKQIEQHLAEGGSLPELEDGLFAGHEVATFDGP